MRLLSWQLLKVHLFLAGIFPKLLLKSLPFLFLSEFLILEQHPLALLLGLTDLHLVVHLLHEHRSMRLTNWRSLLR